MVLGMVTALITLAVVAMGLSSQLLLTHRLQGSTDLAALAASDVLVGRNGELPCVFAGDILRTGGFQLVSCEVGTSSVRVEASADWNGVTLTRRAHAGIANGGQE